MQAVPTSRIQDALGRVLPLFAAVEAPVKRIYPHCIDAYLALRDIKDKIQPYWRAKYAQILWGLVMLFFGGSFSMCLACYQAFYLSGWKTINKAYNALLAGYYKTMTKMLKDPEVKRLVDQNKDGDISFGEIAYAFHDCLVSGSEKDRAAKLQNLCILTKCINPMLFIEAINGFWVGILSVLATLRSRVAQSIAVGTSIGDQLNEVIFFTCGPSLCKLFPDHAMWVEAGIRMVGSTIGVVISMFLVKIVGALKSSVQGSCILTKQIMQHAVRHNYITDDSISSTAGQAIMATLAVVGFLFQCWMQFQIPRLMVIPLLIPFTIERALGFVAAF